MTRTLMGAACGERFPRRADENPGAARRCTAPWSLWNTTPGTAPSRTASAPVRQLCVVVLPEREPDDPARSHVPATADPRRDWSP